MAPKGLLFDWSEYKIIASYYKVGCFLWGYMKNQSIDINQQILCENTTSFERITTAISQLSGKWSLIILWQLYEQPLRFGQLQRALPKITQHMLTQTLRELEQEGLITRTVYAEVPPRVSYALSERGLALKPVFAAIISWSNEV
jgi:DNA-binding HxlR family transcriptional regulator